MSKNQQKPHLNFFAKIINFLNVIIENKFFKPFAITIIVVAVLMSLQQYSGFLINYYQQVKKQKSLTSPIKINISKDKLNINLIEEQTIDYVIQSNDNLLKIFTDLGSSSQDSLAIIEAIKQAKINYSLNSGNTIKITYSVQINYHQIPKNKPETPVILANKNENNKSQTKTPPNKKSVKNTQNKSKKDNKKSAKTNTALKKQDAKQKVQQNKKPNSQILNEQQQDKPQFGYENIKRNITIEKVIINLNHQKQIIVQKNQSPTSENTTSYTASLKEIKLTLYKMRYFGVIKNGLFSDGVDSGISASAMMNMINLYAYDIDFQRDIHSGDKFEMLVESFFDENGKKIKDGNVLYSSIKLTSRQVETYAYQVGGKLEYFDAKGNSVRKSLLRTPINGARVSSGFGMRRHPILGYSKMHKGVDFAAPTGTPILAAGSGTIVYMGVKGGYGNYVQIKHNAEYSTAYGHASKFNKKFKNGSKVSQGDVVAYVGTTGRSTGPHLHFELIYKGAQVNPSKVKATSGLKLVGKDLVKFELNKKDIDKYRKNTPNQYKI